jgi:hypothetical protein
VDRRERRLELGLDADDLRDPTAGPLARLAPVRHDLFAA